MRHCRSCGADISTRPANHFICRVCFGEAARKIQTGTMPVTMDQLGITPDRINQLIRLSHPDRHGNSPEANAATAWLLDLRTKLRASP